MRIAGPSRRHDRVPAIGQRPTVPCDFLDVSERYAENELPQPQPPVEFGFLNVKPEPCIDET